jgi:hypothetical protein
MHDEPHYRLSQLGKKLETKLIMHCAAHTVILVLAIHTQHIVLV